MHGTIKAEIFQNIDSISDEESLSELYEIIKMFIANRTSKETWDDLSPEIQQDIIDALTEDETSLISHEQVMSEAHKRWFK